jgi:glutathione S-transferase
MKLYYFFTPNGKKACGVAKHLGLDIDYRLTDLSKGEQKNPAYLADNPNGKIPLLVDGDNKVWESNAIMCYLADKAGSDLWPRDERLLDVIRWLSWDLAHFSRHAGTLTFQNVIKPKYGIGEPDRAATQEATGFFRQFAGVLDAHLADQDYIVGNGLSVVDFAADTFLSDAEEAEIPLAEFANVSRWHERMMDLPAWRNPYPI